MSEPKLPPGWVWASYAYATGPDNRGVGACKPETAAALAWGDFTQQPLPPGWWWANSQYPWPMTHGDNRPTPWEAWEAWEHRSGISRSRWEVIESAIDLLRDWANCPTTEMGGLLAKYHSRAAELVSALEAAP